MFAEEERWALEIFSDNNYTNLNDVRRLHIATIFGGFQFVVVVDLCAGHEVTYFLTSLICFVPSLWLQFCCKFSLLTLL